jgi:hypothetical protein
MKAALTAAFVLAINTSMNILELDSYNLADAVKFNTKLNPKLWGPDEKLKPEVHAQLLRIADDFREFLGVNDLQLKDITVSGSNAAYTYTPHSDIDLHLVVDLPEADRSEVYRELFDAKKYQYNEMHNIKIGGYDVELYVQDANKPHHSQGIYSVLNNTWIDVPKRRKPDVDDISTRSKYEDLQQRIDDAVKSDNLETISRLAEKIRDMRQAGLDQHGEFGPENLAFKMLRSQGYIQKLYAARNAAKDKELSLRERAPKPKFKYGFKSEDLDVDGVMMTRPSNMSSESIEVEEDLDSDGVMMTRPTNCSSESAGDGESDEDILNDFIDFCSKELKLEQLPIIKLRRDPQWSVVHKTFGRYINDRHMLEVAWGQRHIMDILRTVAHELTHKHQHERDGERMGPAAGETGSPWENEANARAGVLMRDYARLHPDFFAQGQAKELHGNEVAEGFGVVTPAGAKIVAKQNELIDGRKFVYQGYTIEFKPTALEISRGADLVYRKEGNYSNPTRQNLAVARNIATMLASKYTAGNVKESASGYIPTKKQAKDPRFSMALTQDIRPGQLGKEANKLKLKTDSQGHPKQLRANGLVEALALQLEAFKRAREDYSPDNPPGPEFKPTMPAGTLRVDVSDVYDWYKLGNHISNMKGLGRHDFGSGPPSTIVSFGDEDTEHEFIGDLKATGLDVTDIDPKDPKKRPGKTIKTDPTYNVNESGELDEVKMSPTALKKFANSPAAKDVLVGFEAEMIFPNVRVEDSDPEFEPDYEADERAYSLAQVVEFFQYDEWGYGLSDREADRLRERLDEAYYEWYDGQMLRDFEEEAEDYIKKVLVDDGDWDEDEEIQKQLYLLDLSDDQINNIINAGERAPKFTSSKEQQEYSEANPDYKKYLDAQEEAQDLLDTLIQDEIGKQGANWDAALDNFRDNYQLDDDSGFFSDLGWRWMSDIANEFNLTWPYVTDVNSSEGEMDIDSVAEDLSAAIDMPVVASYSYHGAKRKPGEFIIEPDGSLSPDSSEDGGLEIISPPMPIEQAMQKLNQVIEWAQKRGCYTNSSTGLHMGVSLPGQKSFAEAEGDVQPAPATEKPIDFMKLALFLGDQYVLKDFGRQANIYAASTLKKLKERRWSPQQIATAMEKMRGNLINLAYKDLADRSPGRDSINMKDNYVEFRGAGGDYLSRESDEGMNFLENTLLRYVQALAIAGDPAAYRDEYAKKLYKLISPEGDDTLNLFSKFATGEIDQEKLKTEWARKTLEKDDPSAVNKGNWVVVDTNTGQKIQGQEYNGYTQDEVRAQAKQKLSPGASETDFDLRYKIEPQNSGRWEIYRDDQGQEEHLEIIDSPTRGAAADQAYDTYTGVIPFKIRPYYGPGVEKPKPTRRASLAKKIIQRPTQPKDYNYDIIDRRTLNLKVVDRFYATNEKDASATFDSWLKTKGLAPDEDAYGYRKMSAKSDEAEPNVAQNFAPDYSAFERNSDRIDAIRAGQDATEVRRNWEFVNRMSGNVVDTLSNASYQQADAMQADVERRHPNADIYLRSVSNLEENFVNESIDPIQDPKGIGKKIVTSAEKVFQNPVKGQPYRSAIGQAITQKDLENMTQQIQIARRLGDSVMEMEETPPAVLHALDQAAQKNGYRNWADVKTNPRSPQAVMTVAKLADTIMKTTGPHHEKIFYKNKLDR